MIDICLTNMPNTRQIARTEVKGDIRPVRTSEVEDFKIEKVSERIHVFILEIAILSRRNALYIDN
jgi:hypothetical protein